MWLSIDLLQAYNRSRGLICLADASRLIEDQVEQKFAELEQSKPLMSGPALLYVFTATDASSQQSLYIPECAIPVPTEGYKMVIGPSIKGFLSKVYRKLQGDCDILHALPEDSIICTEEDEITRNGDSLKGIFTYEEIKTSAQGAGVVQGSSQNSTLAQPALSH